MPQQDISPTPYPYVNAALQMLLTNVTAVLGDYFVGLYLHGSLASGDFDPGHSDIDFIAVTAKEIPEKLIRDLEAMHTRIRDSGSERAKKLEGTYISRKALRLYNPKDRPRPFINAGKFFMARPDIDWVINRYILRHGGVAVAGPPIQSMIAEVNDEELRRAVVEGIWTEWRHREDDREWLKPPGHQPFVVLTNCRALYTLEHGTIASKPVSARWALTALDREWTNLIKAALAWHKGMPPGDIDNTLKMMRYTLEKVKAYRG